MKKSPLFSIFLIVLVDVLGLTIILPLLPFYAESLGTTPENRAKSFGMIGIAFGLGFLIGPAASGYLAQFSHTYPILAAAALSLTSVLCTYFLLPAVAPHPTPETEQGRPSRWSAYIESFKDGKLGPMLWQFFAFTFAFSTLFSGFALFAERRM